MYSFKQASVHQDFLLHLFNPANDGKTSHEYFTKDGQIIMYNSANEKSEVSKIKPLPNFAEFKLLISLLYFSQKRKNKTVAFTSANQLLKAIGYPPCGNTIKLLNRTIERYQWFRIHYKNSLNLDLKADEAGTHDPNLPVNKGNLNTKKHTRNIGILVGFDKDIIEENIVTVIFDENFWNICNGDCGFAKRVNLAVVKELKSPRQLQIYLFLCKWMNGTVFAKYRPFSIESFVEETGIHFNNFDRNRYNDLMSDIKQTLNTVYRVDLECRQQNHETVKSQTWNIKVRESVFKKKRNLQFVSPNMKYHPPNGTDLDSDVMEFSEWKELFPDLTTDDWTKCEHTKKNFTNQSPEISIDDNIKNFEDIKVDTPLQRKPLPLKIIEKQIQREKQILKELILNELNKTNYCEDPYADF